jgi:hypothetical protein
MNRRIDVKTLKNGLFEGEIVGYGFRAKVYDTDSEFGINKGRISKPEVWSGNAGFRKVSVRYDRGRDIKPASDEQRALPKDLLSRLEALPVGGLEK